MEGEKEDDEAAVEEDGDEEIGILTEFVYDAIDDAMEASALLCAEDMSDAVFGIDDDDEDVVVVFPPFELEDCKRRVTQDSQRPLMALQRPRQPRS